MNKSDVKRARKGSPLMNEAMMNAVFLDENEQPIPDDEDHDRMTLLSNSATLEKRAFVPVKL